MIRDLGYRPYRPSGYTDDLGIIADRNQWVPEQVPGWYVFVSGPKYMEVVECLIESKIKFDRSVGDQNMLIFDNKNDVVELMLRVL